MVWARDVVPHRGVWFNVGELIVRIGALLLAARILLSVYLGYVASEELFVASTFLGLGLNGVFSGERAEYAWWYGLWGAFTAANLVVLAGSTLLGRAALRGLRRTVASLGDSLRD